MSRRKFVTDVGALASAASIAGCMTPAPVPALAPRGAPRTSGEWDLSWTQTLASATDRAVFDWPSLGEAGDSIVMQIAARYLDNCAAAYGATPYKAIAVMNIRTTAIPAAMTDAAWARYSLGTEYTVKDPVTQATATRNLFWGGVGQASPFPQPSLEQLVQRGSIILVCDFAMGHLSTRLAAKTGRTAESVHDDLRHSLVPGAFAVPSGIFGLARAQNAGCAFVRM